jgi:hypothetical protein
MEKPGLAKRLATVIAPYYLEAALDPLDEMYRVGASGLRASLKKLSVARLKDVMEVHRIPCKIPSKKGKAELIEVIVSHAENRHAAQTGCDLAAA